MERLRRDDTGDVQLLERTSHPADRLQAVGAVDDELREQRIVVQPHLVARRYARIPAHARSRRCLQLGDAAGGREKAVERILTAYPTLDRVAERPAGIRLPTQWIPRRHTDLLLDQVHAGHQLRHRVLDLDSGVHLEEVELAIDEEELHGTRSPIPHGPSRFDRHPAHPLAQRLVHDRGGRLLDQFLVAALDRALALTEVNDRSASVGEHLNLDVTRSLEKPLQVYPRIAERLLGLAPRPLQSGLQLIEGAYDPHALPATARGGLEHQREADITRSHRRILATGYGVRSRDDGHAGIPHELAGAGLVAHRLDRLRRRADEDDARFADGTGEIRVLGQKAVSRVNRLRVRLPGGGDQLASIQIAFGRPGGPDRNGQISLQHVGRQTIRVGVDGHGLDAQLATGTDHAHRDLAPVRHQDPGERWMVQRGILPCFLGGFRSRLFPSTSRPEIRCCLVWRGSMTSST